MTSLRSSSHEVRERDGRFFAWDVPGDAQIVALVQESAEAERSATVVDAIATSIARRREHTLLLSAEPGPSPLDELLGGVESEGLPAALGGRARLTDVAVQRPDRPFVYLPAGPDAEAMQALLEDDVLASFVGRVRERGGTLFLLVSENTRLSAGICELVDGYVTLGKARVPKGVEDLPPLGRVRFEDEVSSRTVVPPPRESSDAAPFAFAAEHIEVEPEAEDLMKDEDPGAVATVPNEAALAEDLDDEKPVGGGRSWLQHRAPPRFPAGLVGGGVGVVAALLVGWWWFANVAGSGLPAGSGPATVERAEASSFVETSPPLDPAEVGLLFETAPALPFSVLIASYADRSDAQDRVGRLRSGPDAANGLFFISPTPVRGVIYHRVLAGALPTEAEAESLMDRLVASGEKDEASLWHLRPVRLAFDLGVFVDRANAEARIADLELRGVPSYVLTASLDGRHVYQVHAGGYEAEPASLPMAQILDDAGEPATLVARHGGATTPSTP